MKTLRWLLLAALTLLGMVLALSVGLWRYSASDGSLAIALRALTLIMPSTQQLTWQDVSGSVRHGGHLGALHWQRDGLQVRAQDVTLRWHPQALLRGQLLLDELSVGVLRIDDQTPSSDTEPVPPADLRLPVQVDAHVKVGALEWAGRTTQRAERIALNYTFNSYQHILDKGEAIFSSNKYAFSGTLQATARMALALQLRGQVTAPVPGGAPLPLNANATLTGELAGRAAELTLQTDLRPAAPGSAMQATLSARLAPWQAQPLRSVQAHWQALDLAVLWSQAPQTLLTGQAQVKPQGTGWQAAVQLSNARSGPWNLQRLPVRTLQSELDYFSGHWRVRKLIAQGAGGTVDADGQLSAPATWQVRARLRDIDPTAIDTRLPGAALRGELSMRQALPVGTVAAPLAFTLDLQNHAATPRVSAAATTLTSVASATTANLSSASAGATQLLHRVQAQGVWARPSLTLNTLQIDAQNAQLQGSLRLDSASRALQGQLDLRLPGARATWQGQLGPKAGQGALSVQISNAAQTSQWLARWPLLAQALRGRWSGDAALAVQWHGGWQNQLQAMQLQGQLRAGQLGWTAATDAPSGKQGLALRDLQIDVSGSPAALSVGGRGQLAMQAQPVRWQAHGVAARLVGGDWQMRIDDAQMALLKQTKPPVQAGAQAGQDNWRLALDAAPASPLLLRWQPGSGAGQWALSPSSARLQGPLAGSASLHWQTLQWSPTGWQSVGQIEHLPLRWLDTVTRRSLSELGLRSDMLLSGRWQANQSSTLHASVTLERASGDLFLQSGEGSQSAIAADMREAWLQANLNDGDLSASLRWDSLRAGKALVAFSTQVRSSTGDWRWGEDVPVAASVQLQLPPMNVWSALAPPGWRLRGTVSTHIDLTGTLRQPSWSGSLQARDLALRSVVDGIDLRQGRLDATLHDQQLDLHAFTLRGAASKDTDGGQLTLSGNVFWRPAASRAALRQQIQMSLQAQLQSLRLNTRADRRLIASGKLDAQLKDGVLALRGALRADHALFTLPDDSAPSLSDDVVVRRGLTAPAAAPPRSTWANSPGIDVAIDLNPGDDFQVRGRGMDTRLGGVLRLTAVPGRAPQLHGNLRSVAGSYRAYGQTLTIERGIIRFTGAVDNPALDVLALRPKLTQRVGVQITGSVLSPIVALYAEPDLPDAEKLAWLVLGRSASAGGAEAALLQQAAMSLLGGNGKGVSESLGAALGLDELSFRGSTQTSDGSASGASITLGKRLSGDFYVTYQRSLDSTVGVVSIFFDLSKRLRLRAQSGEQSAVDLIYAMRYD